MEEQYKVLYRKYRPTSFLEVVGQTYTIEMLKNAVINNKISHAYIFTGPRGTGKTSTAKIFAKTINCENPENGVPCGKCSTCLNADSNADIIEIDAASNNGVDEIRELIDNVKVAPSFSKYKVYIIDEVHMMTQSAFNALLKTLEEPPSHVIFIFATTNIESVPITILSRCQRYDFKKIDTDVLIDHLKKISKAENIKITDDAIAEIAYLSEGGCRDALSILNQLSTSYDSIDLDSVLNNYGSVSNIMVERIVKSFISNDYETIKEIFNDLKTNGVDYKVFIKKLVDYFFKEALIFKEKGNNELYLKIKQVIFELNDIINKINITIDPFLLIFLSLVQNMNIKCLQIANDDNLKSDVESDKLNIENDKNELKNEEKRDNDNKVNTNVSPDYIKYIKDLTSIRVNNCFAKADKKLLNECKKKWQDFVDSLKETNSLKTVLIDSNVVLASNDLNIIVCSQDSMAEMFNLELDKIAAEYLKNTKQNMQFIALTNKEWEDDKKEYVKRLKEHYVYKIMDEPIYNENKKDEEIPSIVGDVFDKDKIEIEEE